MTHRIFIKYNIIIILIYLILLNFFPNFLQHNTEYNIFFISYKMKLNDLQKKNKMKSSNSINDNQITIIIDSDPFVLYWALPIILIVDTLGRDKRGSK